MEQSIVHNISVAHQQSKKLLVEIAVMFQFRLFSTIVSQTYLQSSDICMIDIYLIPRRKRNLKKSSNKASKAFVGSFKKRWLLWKNLRKPPRTKSRINSLYFWCFFPRTSENIIKGTRATHVDDTFHAENNGYCHLSEETEKNFKCRPREWDNTLFAAVLIKELIIGFKCMKRSKLKNWIEFRERVHIQILDLQEQDLFVLWRQDQTFSFQSQNWFK